MHYRTDKTGFDEISHIDDFVKLFYEVDRLNNPFILSNNGAQRIAVMNYGGIGGYNEKT